MEYKIVRQKTFGKIETFEKELNGYAMQGWRVVTSYAQGSYLILERSKK
jgi:hypothetical protein